MKVEVNTASFADAVAWTTSVIDARPANPILAGVKLEAADGTMQLSAFTYEISARDHIEAGVDESGTVVVLGKLLADISKVLPAEKNYLSANETTMTITSARPRSRCSSCRRASTRICRSCLRRLARWTPKPSRRPSPRPLRRGP